MAEPIVTGAAAAPVGPYPHARAAGGLLFLSGIGPREPGTDAIPDGFEAQCRATFANVRAVVAAAGARWEDIADVTCFLVHMERDFPVLNRLWSEAFPDPATRPCRTTVEVTRLPTPIDIELKVIVAPGGAGGAGMTALDAATLDRLAAELLEAERSQVPVDQLSARHPALDARGAYAIQQRIVATRLAAGDRIVGWKVGLTSLAMQRQLGVDQPDYGPILASTMVEDGGTIEAAALIAPRVEAEVAFWLARPLRGPGVTVADVLAATEAVSPALEVVDSRVRDWKLTLVDTVADMASTARIIVGAPRVDPAAIDLRLVGVTIDVDGDMASTGAGAACLGHPAAAVAWAANTLGELGVTLEAGHLVMPGALHASVPVRAGHTYRARFDRLGDVTVVAR